MTITTGLCEVSMNLLLVRGANPHRRGLQSWRRNNWRMIQRIVRLFPTTGEIGLLFRKRLYRRMKDVKAVGGSSDHKFFCQKVTPRLSS